MKTKTVLLLCGILTLQWSITAQPCLDAPIFNTNQPTRCATDQMQAFIQCGDVNAETEAQFEEWISRKVAELTISQRNVITIPIVVHVIHAGEPLGLYPNVIDEQIISQINVLNQDFRRMVGTPGHNTHPAGADMEIEFELAKIDPNGNPTDGINRVNLDVITWSTTEANVTMKPATIWNPDLYLNVWTCRLDGALGYAQFPIGSGLSDLSGDPNGMTDGIVIGTKYFGTVDEDNGNFSLDGTYNRGRTLTHELGHFLGVRHIWGNGGCTVDDYCDDTPLSDNANQGCATGHQSCGTLDMIENYMDYTIDVCMNVFTNDQKARMQAVLANSPRRKTLVSSTVSTTRPDLAAASSFALFPNPSKGAFSIRMENLEQAATIRIYDVVGRLVLSASANNGTTPFDLSQQPEGLYFVEVSVGSDTFVEKIILR